MNLFTKLILSLLVAAAATAVAHALTLSTPLQLGGVIALACLISTILGNLSGSRASSTASNITHDQHAPGEASAELDGEREIGTVKWFNVSKGFGFIVRENGEEIFVHFRSIRGDDKSRRGLRDGQSVSYVVLDSDKGPQAEDVEPL